MDIKPVYVNLEQAKLLKAKGFNELCTGTYEGNIFSVNNRAWRNSEDPTEYTAPEQWMVVEWLRINHNLWIEVFNCNVPEIGKWGFDIHRLPSGVAYLWNNSKAVFNSPQDTYSAAFDYVLENMLN